RCARGRERPRHQLGSSDLLAIRATPMAEESSSVWCDAEIAGARGSLGSCSSRARHRRSDRGSMLRMSAACNHLRLPASARMMTCWYVMARSTAVAVTAISTPLGADGRTTPRPKSGHFICSRERTDHVLSTDGRPFVDISLESV